MKIAIVHPDDHSILVISKALVKKLVEIENCEVVTISSGANYIQNIKNLGAFHIQVKMHRFISPVKDLQYCFSLYKIFKKHKFDVVLNYTAKPIIYGTLAARMARNKKVMCAFRGMGRIFHSELDFKGKIIKAIVLGYYWIACKLSTKIWFTNVADMDYFLANGYVNKTKIFLTTNCINIKYFSNDSVNKVKLEKLQQELGLNNNLVIIMVARMIWHKGIKEFVEASKLLKDRFRSARFVLVGPLEVDSMGAVPESYLRESEKSDNFQWLGFRNDVRDLYAVSDIAVLPSYLKEGGYPRALLEPMAMGKPVIASDTPDCRGPIEEGQNGYLVPIKNSKALAESLGVLLSDKDKIEQFGQYSRLKVEKEFDEKFVVDQTINEIKKLYLNKFTK